MTLSNGQENLGLGIILTLSGFFVLSCADMLVKYLGASYHFLQMIVTLPTIAAIVILVAALLLKKKDSLIAKTGLRWQIIRGLMMPVGTMIVFYTLPRITLSSFYAVVFSAPIITSVLSIIFLKEKVYWQRWVGIFFGFVGVLIVIKPGMGDFNPALLLILVSASLFSISAILIRKFSQAHSAIGYAFVTHAVSASCCLCIFIIFGGKFIIPSSEHALLFLFCGSAFGLGGFLVTKGIMLAQASIVAPFHYSQIIWGIIFGYFVFDTLPKTRVIIGAIIVISSGLYIWYRENKIRKPGQRTMVIRRTIISIPRREK